ncbi:hypothetical protein Zm00014a_034228 [Zea mays]|nr:hypothetical protein Zm00014a_034228 [Zea mays]
MITFMN